MIDRGPALYETVAGYAAEEYEQHRAILEAVRTRNADVARLRMKQHLVYVSDLYLRSFAE
jgi:DNA-binding FadR family transcriptional regulator